MKVAVMLPAAAVLLAVALLAPFPREAGVVMTALPLQAEKVAMEGVAALYPRKTGMVIVT